jgi:hypothetical protein
LEIAGANSSATTFDLGTSNLSSNYVIVTINGVIQRPTDDYVITANNIVFTTAPLTGDDVYVRSYSVGPTGSAGPTGPTGPAGLDDPTILWFFG